MVKRKILVVAVIVILCLAIGSVAFAAPSPTGGSVAAKDADGNPVQVTVAAVGNADELKAQIDTAKAPGTVAWLQDVTVEDYAGGPITLTLAVNGVKTGDEVTVIHYVNGAWEYVKPDSVAGRRCCKTGRQRRCGNDGFDVPENGRRGPGNDPHADRGRCCRNGLRSWQTAEEVRKIMFPGNII